MRALAHWAMSEAVAAAFAAQIAHWWFQPHALTQQAYPATCTSAHTLYQTMIKSPPSPIWLFIVLLHTDCLQSSVLWGM